jgi:hypothetical protein
LRIYFYSYSSKFSDYTVSARLNALVATDAGIGLNDYGVFVEKEINLPQDPLRACFYALPTSLAASAGGVNKLCLNYSTSHI